MHPSVEFHDKLAINWDKKYHKKSFYARVLDILSLLKCFNLEGQMWLDAGCGTGNLSRMLVKNGCTVYGLDASPSMIKQAQAFSNNDPLSKKMNFVLIGTVENLPFKNYAFDGVLCASVIEYLDNPEICLKEMSRVLKKDGLIIVSVANYFSLFRKFQSVCYYLTKMGLNEPYPAYLKYLKNQYTRYRFNKLLNGVGIKIIKWTYGGLGLSKFLGKLFFIASILTILGVKNKV
jgi:ubiquinone/menaquinone biosynthesis C-methylase UbiE